MTREQKAIQEAIKICLPEADANAFIEAAAKVAETIAKAIQAMIKTANTAWEKAKERIQTMSEEEYAEFLEELTPEARGWAAAIRAGGKKNDTGN